VRQCIWLLLVTFIVPAPSSSRLWADEPPVKVRVGSKGFTESVVLGELLTQLIRHSGHPVQHRAELGGTQVLWKAMQQGGVDVYVDYTGTIREELLASAQRQGHLVSSEQDLRDRLAEQFAVSMSERIGFNNTYALGMKEHVAQELGISKISDLGQHPDLRLGVSDEFMERQDGWHKLARHYQLPQRSVRTMDHNLAYRGLEHDAIQLTDLYTTDAEIAFYGLRTLEDDLKFFPTYYAVVLVRSDLKQRAPNAWDAIMKMEGLVAPEEMVGMTARVRLDRRSEASVAAEFLNAKLGLQLPIAQTGWRDELGKVGWRLLRTTWEHLFLVAVSLTLAIAISIPLGILAARYEAFGQAILAVVSVIQTLPSMALLVFMIPLFGLGSVPAIAALFFYSLLPIVRSTYLGLTQISTALRESGMALGLDRNAQLRLVELPLAMPSILAGIKTAAVINVGTATIGALIGAGGYGSPILTGIRLFNIPLLLQGAIPAACLALLVQFAFGYLERILVSPGLRSLR
jgi:osmoprotectant transport system permease protein